MAREPIETWFFALAVVRLGRRFLLVQEQKHDGLWYLPAGRAEPGETLFQTAVRETREESGVDIRLEQIIRLEHTPQVGGGARVRAWFLASPLKDTDPKSEPDEHSRAARWCTLEELAALDLRGPEVAHVLHHVADGGPLYPLSLLTLEGQPLS